MYYTAFIILRLVLTCDTHIHTFEVQIRCDVPRLGDPDLMGIGGGPLAQGLDAVLVGISSVNNSQTTTLGEYGMQVVGFSFALAGVLYAELVKQPNVQYITNSCQKIHVF